MAYSDRDLLIATQIAYYDIDPKYEGCSLRDILSKDKSIFNKLNDNLKNANSKLEIERAQKALSLYKEITSPSSKYGDWIIKDVNNDNNNSGFYGCLIETDDNSAIVGFRGSESYNIDQTQKDWVESDFGLLNSEHTGQQDVATEYMNYINNKYNYNEYALSGHSLGGNLAVHAGITAPKSMQDKINQCYSYDGPGFSDEYIKSHMEEIQRFGNKITHYQWSLVGALLNQIPGENFKSIKTRDVVYGKNDMNSLTQKHDTCFVEFDEDGNVIPGEMDNFAKTIGKLSRNIDNADIGNGLVKVIGAFMTMSDSEKKLLTIVGFAGGFLALVTAPVATVAVVTTIAAILIAGLIDPDFYANVLVPFLAGAANVVIKVVDFVKNVASKIYKKFKEVINNFKNFMNNLYKSIEKVVNNIANWLYKHSAGYKYATANPCISINTTTMKSYASQLRTLSRRSKTLDRKMNNMYWHLGIEWDTIANLGKLFKSGIILDFAGRLDKCANYLDKTAEEFNSVERDLQGLC